MKRIGITGNIGAGKTYVTTLFHENHKIPYINSDKIVNRLQECDPYVRNKILNMLGPKAYLPSTEGCGLDKQYVSSVIFKDPAKLDQMVDIIRGPLLYEFEKECYHYQYMVPTPAPFILFESAVLMERGLYKMFDFIIIVDAPIELREERAISRGTHVEDFKQRTAKQMPTDDITRILSKSMIPHRVIENTGQDLTQLIKMVSETHGWKEGNKE